MFLLRSTSARGFRANVRSLHGGNFIGVSKSCNGTSTFKAVNPLGNDLLEPSFHNATPEEINTAMRSAEDAFLDYQKKTPSEIASFLRQIAGNISAKQDAIVARAGLETGLPSGRLNNETSRTTGQLEHFAKLVEEGSWVEARISLGGATASDLRRMLMPLGPVAVFGASNFPLAFSTAGGDTASALAAKCPVVVKAHPAHPGTCELVAEAILDAAQTTGMPQGVFSLLHGNGPEVGQALVRHPSAAAVGFTGSLAAGRALFDAAAARPSPIPVFAEMGSVNPVLLLPGALAADAEALATALAGSVTLGAGQFCTNPGLLLLAPAGGEAAAAGGSSSSLHSDFLRKMAETLDSTPPSTMLTSGIRDAYEQGLSTLTSNPHITTLTSPRPPTGDLSLAPSQTHARPTLLHADAASFSFSSQPQAQAQAQAQAQSEVQAEEAALLSLVQTEVFGPVSLAVGCATRAELGGVLRGLGGQLTVSVFGTGDDLAEYADEIGLLRQRAGRVIFNDVPTGVEVCSAMTHGGPYPASTAPASTSVGAEAIKRFVRPVSFQGAPQALLPMELRDENESSVYRLVNDRLTNGPLN